MPDLKYVQLESDIQSALKLCGWVKFLKIVLALLVLLSYFFFPDWLGKLIVISVVISLVLPLGFFDVFIQKLLEYNTQKTEERQTLNAKEANEHFDNLYKRVGK
ncbi:MAG TPA: hypothetical protein DF774_05435 [Rheinheimera sp.]|uniref:hypothetical protein n=1 Tax=Rheinheimera sp. TaxID=1869214 RepID=UPI000EC90102|nr:hypothetical protein [Rheinheimera sp.]HCU65188.1 hypothetical protein [Rheinheimera sp.]